MLADGNGLKHLQKANNTFSVYNEKDFFFLPQGHCRHESAIERFLIKLNMIYHIPNHMLWRKDNCTEFK